ncbi:hypothetical protein AMS68_003883 [Peltaster fructicola]|uniref:Trafficking protein particle complex subunit 6B n=1 Tax=Peltaster fructicola TaxID=286661 RepID=A0A6H0XUK6_9PEZI|nr:hypothetical protein AMS68_003883 [Peltaster fructicola]
MSKPAAPVEPLPLEPVLATSCLDFLLIELVPLAQRMVERIHAREQNIRDEYKRSQSFHKAPHIRNASTTATQDNPESQIDAASSVVDSTKDTTADTTTLAGAVDDDVRDTLFWKLDQMGYRVGQGLVERFSVNKPRPQSPLDAIKFICKDLWILLFKKQIDNLKTNHRGVFVLTDNKFPPMAKMSLDMRRGPRATEEANKRAQTFCYFPCGVIRGALSGLGVDVTVTADVNEVPAAIFHLKMKTTKP